MTTKPQENDATTEASPEQEEELVAVETAPSSDEEGEGEDDEVRKPRGEDIDDDDDDDDDEDGDEDGDDEDGDDDDKTARNRRRRRKRREMQRRAKEAKDREIELLRQQNQQMMERMQRLEGYTSQTQSERLQQEMQNAAYEVQQAERIIAKASEKGNGEDVVQAMRIRDAAIARYRQLEARSAQQQAQNQTPQPQQAPQPQPQNADPRVQRTQQLAQSWLQQNSWYNPQGSDETAQLVRSIDAEVMRDGYDPSTVEYWQELTNRVADAFEGDDPEPKQKAKSVKKKAPPTGQARNATPKTNRKEIYVTPERKQAMIDAGVWDDPVQRQRYLKAYQAYDTDNADR